MAIRKLTTLAVLGAALGLLAGCSQSTAPGSARVSLSVAASLSGAAKAGGLSAASDTLSDGEHTLVLTSMALVLRKVQLEPAGADTDDWGRGDATMLQPAGGDHHGGDPGDGGGDYGEAEGIDFGPLLVELPLDGGVEHLVTVDAPAGTYDKVEFQVHVVTGNAADAVAFRDAHPDFASLSIRVQGLFDGAPFVYESDLTAEQNGRLSPPLVVDEGGGTVNLTLQFDVSNWFRDRAGVLIDPATANTDGPNEHLVMANIKRSFNAFRDNDHNGACD